MRIHNFITKAKDSFKNEMVKRPLFYSIFLFSAIFLFSRLISIFIPYVEITYDSLEYVNYIDKYTSKGLFPPVDFLPIGYPVIIKILTFLHNSIYSIVFFQNIITFFAIVLVIIATEKSYPRKSIFVVIPFCIFVLSAKSLFYDITIITESLYTSSLIFASAFLIFALNSLKKRDWILLSVSLFIPILFRPNGAFTIVIFLIILLYCLFKIRKKAITISFALPYLILLLFLSTYSMLASKNFTVTSPSRLQGELNTKLQMDEGNQIKFGEECLCLEKPSLRKAIKQYYFFKGSNSFNPKLKNIYEKYHVFNWPTNLNYGSPDSTYVDDKNKLATEVEKQNTFKEFYNKSYAESIELRAKKYRKTVFFKVYDWYQMNIHKTLFANFFWPLAMFLSFIIGLLLYLRSKLNNSNYLLLLLICLLNIGTNMIHIITTHRTLARYEYPGEFFYYLVPFFLIICLKNVKK